MNEPDITFEEPKELTPNNVIYWSKSAKRLEGVKEGSAIKTKAIKFLKLGCVQYDPEFQCFFVNPIKNYNKTRYQVESGGKHFKCNCQFYNKVSKDWDHPTCSHIQAVKMFLEIKQWNKKHEKEKGNKEKREVTVKENS